MEHKLLYWSGLIVAVLVTTQLLGLAVLRYNIGHYADYWHDRAGQQGDFLYVAIGDSAAQGLGASRPQLGYPGLIATSIERTTGRNVRLVNLSVTGAKLEDALRQQIPELKKHKPDLVTAEIGANDMTSFDKSVFAADYERFVQALPPGKTIVSNMPYFGTRPQYNNDAQAANHIIGGIAHKHDIPMADLYSNLQSHQTPFIYASDWFHPNDRGYHIWYDAFWRQVEAWLPH